jgi:pyruvate kinase
MIEQSGRRTKVIKSFEGSALSPTEAERVLREEVDVVRLVYKPEALHAIRNFLEVLGSADGSPGLPVMIDVSGWTQGSIHNLKEPREVTFGDKLTFSPVGGSGTLQVRTDFWQQLFKEDSCVYLGTGMVALKVSTVKDKLVELVVEQGGTIYPDMEIVIPETRKDPERYNVDLAQLAPILDQGVDYLVVPGQWSASRLSDFRAALTERNGDKAPWIIVKVDSGDVYERLETLLGAADGVLISRREMALTVNPATVPMITKEIIQLCNDEARIVVTASEMLASMRYNATPTRAEVSDMANAVIDGTDAIVLSEEVANGKYGSQAVAVTHRIIQDIEAQQAVKPNWIKAAPPIHNEMDAVASSAYRTAERINSKALVTITKAGNTALKLASFRPPIPIIAVTFSPWVRRRLAVVRGVETILLEMDPNLDEVLPVVNDRLVRNSWLKAGDSIIFVAITLSPLSRESSNLLTVQTLT